MIVVRKTTAERLADVEDATQAQIWAQEILEPLLAPLRDTALVRDRAGECIPRSFLVALGSTGLFRLLVPRTHGGLGGNRRTLGLILEQIGRISNEVELPSLISLFADLPSALVESGNTQAIAEFLPDMLTGQCLSAFAYTEEGDVSAFQTKLTETDSELVLNGTKVLVTGATCADVFLVYVSGADGLEVVLLKASDPGVRIEPVSTMGFRTAGMGRLTFENVRLSHSRRLFGSDGLGQVQRFLGNRRLFVVCAYPGRMASMLSECSQHLSRVIRDGAPLTTFHNVQSRLGRMYAQTKAAQVLLRTALDHWVSPACNDVFDAHTVAAKYTIAELAIQTARDAIYVTGWQGYSDRLPFERDLRSFMGAVAGQTTQDKLELLLGANFVAYQAMNSQHEVL